MSEIDNGGPAFPVTPMDSGGQIATTMMGMSLREWFAGMALHGLLANPSVILKQTDIPELSFEYADSMIRVGKGEK